MQAIHYCERLLLHTLLFVRASNFTFGLPARTFGFCSFSFSTGIKGFFGFPSSFRRFAKQRSAIQPALLLCFVVSAFRISTRHDGVMLTSSYRVAVGGRLAARSMSLYASSTPVTLVLSFYTFSHPDFPRGGPVKAPAYRVVGQRCVKPRRRWAAVYRLELPPWFTVSQPTRRYVTFARRDGVTAAAPSTAP